MSIDNPYVELRENRPYIVNHRVPLTSLAFMWQEGASPETIRENFPTLSLAQIFGGLAYYLDHREAVDEMLADDDATFLRLRTEQQALYPERAAEWERRQ